MTMQGPDRIRVVSDRLRSGEQIDPLTVREFLSWFGAKRRGYMMVHQIREALEKYAVVTEPDFEVTYIDGEISLKSAYPQPAAATGPATPRGSSGTSTTEITAAGTLRSGVEPPDPTHRISKLAAANNPPVSVTPDAPLQEAVTLMLSRGFSQLPVMTTPREVKGIVSWQSIGARLGVGMGGTHVRDMLDQHQEVRHDASIFQVIPVIVAHDYVLVRGSDNSITGIVTASDLSLQFLQLSEPFLLLSEIENQIRQLIAKRFSAEDLAACQDPLDVEREVAGASDLAFGEYIRLLEKPENWTKSHLPLDRNVFCKQLIAVRDIRNDVMHFDPDGIAPDELDTLREFTRFLQRIMSMGVG